MGSREPAQECVLTACTNCGEVARFDARCTMSHSIDAAMLAKQGTRADALFDLGSGDPGPGAAARE